MKKTSTKSAKSLKSQLSSLSQLIARHHVIIFLVISLGSLTYAVYTVNQTLSMPTDSNYQTEQLSKSISTRFDENTIDKVNQLRSRQEAAAVRLPGGRINPFNE